ncbi:hypothetical protein [Heyndrickxia ginsengihumi]|uniref:hypothetical protein n=1 Tax=Heyndrickxia ginsengihumi TaxID=363870 RepID=UPI00203E870F|nr:hypothetical protein [Heyndrickxia ginsengihumi]MCM3024612.1 hypothetical protein [Heyndrickxia ginsengihumi]
MTRFNELNGSKNSMIVFMDGDELRTYGEPKILKDSVDMFGKELLIAPALDSDDNRYFIYWEKNNTTWEKPFFIEAVEMESL